MNIALIADDRKKQLMIDFCLLHAGTLCRHNLYATGTTGKLVEDVTGLKVHRFMPGRQGGDQQIASRIAHDEIDLLLFFRDTVTAGPEERHDQLLCLCDTHGLPYATNLTAAELVMRALKDGTLQRLRQERLGK